MADAARTITGLGGEDPAPGRAPVLGMQQHLVVFLSGDRPLRPHDWVLFLNGYPMYGLPVMSPDGMQQLRFQLRRTERTRNAWNDLIGSSDAWTRTISVSVAHVRSFDPATGTYELLPRLAAEHGALPSFQLNILRTAWLGVAAVAVIGLLWVVIDRGCKTALLRDNVMPQIPPLQRPFSLGRVQMAFWFVLVLGSFLFLWALLWDYNTITGQTLTLMGISSATGLGALLANSSNDETLRAARKRLVDAKFLGPEDIDTARSNLLLVNATLGGNAVTEERKSELNREKAELVQRIAVYDEVAPAWCHRTFWSDMINDDGGPALHRIQVLAWTMVLGGLFALEVYRSLSMPQFNETLLALMAVSGGTYVGFKIPEQT